MAMRKLFLFALIVLATSCGGEAAETDETASSPTVTEAVSETTEAPEPEALPPLSSVPFGEYGTSHVDPPVSFATSPSTGGNHYPFWQNCGYYTTPVLEGAATHTLEHGAVWITYNESEMSEEDLAALEALSAGNPKLLISPYDHDEPIVLSAWGVQQRGVAAPTAVGASDDIAAFVKAWVDNPALQEAGVTCGSSAGVPPDSPRTFPDGQEIPDSYN